MPTQILWWTWAWSTYVIMWPQHLSLVILPSCRCQLMYTGYTFIPLCNIGSPFSKAACHTKEGSFALGDAHNACLQTQVRPLSAYASHDCLTRPTCGGICSSLTPWYIPYPFLTTPPNRQNIHHFFSSTSTHAIGFRATIIQSQARRSLQHVGWWIPLSVTENNLLPLIHYIKGCVGDKRILMN